MGLIGSIVKIGSKALNYGKRALKCAPEFVFGESATVIGKAYKAAPKGSIFSKAKVAGKAFESHVGKLATKGGFLTRLWKTTVGLPKALSTSAKAGMRLAGMKGTNKFLGALKGLGKGIGKKMPYIGALLTIAFEIPSIINGYKKEGAKGALKQTAGAGIELGCMATGAAIGSCFPGVGTLIGGLIGGLVGLGVRALTFPEPKDDETQEAEQENQDTDTSESDSSSDASATDSASDSSSSSATSSDSATGISAGVASIGSVPYPTTTGMTNPFGMGLNVPNPISMGMGMGLVNPFGTGFGMMGGFGYNSNQALVNSILQPGENIFLKYPTGYTFQYMG